jgi:AcrR family transcriptional regulator
MASSTRERLIEATSELVRRQGLAATGVKQILAAADAPFSSLYHHFPGGKEQLAAAAIRSAGLGYQRLVEEVWDGEVDLEASVRAIFDGAAGVLVATDFADACPIATVALEVASTNEQLRLATAEVFGAWIGSAVDRLTSSAVAPDRAAPLANVVIALLEGAFILARAAKSTEPLTAARDGAVTLVRAGLGPDAAPTTDRCTGQTAG